MTIRVALIDDHPVVLDGLRAALDAVAGIEVIGAAATLADGRALLARDSVDVAIVDLRLPDGSGTQLVSEAAKRGRPATLVFSSFDHASYVTAAIRLGAAGFLLKTTPTHEVVTAVRTVAAGGTSYTAEQLRNVQRPAIALSLRERQVVQGLIASRSNDEIATDLGLSRKTVEQHLSRLFDRFLVASRTELALRAEREGWLDL